MILFGLARRTARKSRKYHYFTVTLEICGFEFLREDCELKRREVWVGAGLLAGDAGEEPPGDEAAPSRGAPHVSAHSNQHLEKRSGGSAMFL